MVFAAAGSRLERMGFVRPVSFLLGLVWLANMVFAQEPVTTQTSPRILQLTVEDAIGPATDDYIKRALETATKQAVTLVVIRLDTPGGLDAAMRNIIKNITTSHLPVVTYVAPTGARAASAGTYILYASHVAAMAPGTNLGAATPVQIGGGLPFDPKGKSPEDKDKSKAADDTMKHKIINDAVAYIRGLAELRGRNQDWAEKAVREAASLPAKEALKLNVIDVVATDMGDLLKQIHGRKVMVLGQHHVINTEAAVLVEHPPDWRSQLLSVLTNPNVAYILMLIGIYGLIFEFSNPGAIVPGTVGAIALLLALYSFQMLPINYAGMALMLLGIALMVGEAFQPSFGVLGIGGAIAFVIGSIILMDTEAPGFGIEITVILSFTVFSLLIFVVVVGMALKARRRPVVSGMEEMIGSEGIVLDDFDGSGAVQVHSERWSATSEVALQEGQKVKVTGMKGLLLKVVPANNGKQEDES